MIGDWVFIRGQARGGLFLAGPVFLSARFSCRPVFLVGLGKTG
jgi:hypothetical protein